jgi:hypothetical protein
LPSDTSCAATAGWWWMPAIFSSAGESSSPT